jgi:CBS domain-containing protein
MRVSKVSVVRDVFFSSIVGYILFGIRHGGDIGDHMKVSGILRVKGNTLFTVTPDEPLARAVDIMAEKDIVKNGGTLGTTQVRSSMDDHPLTCTTETEIDEVRRMMLERHARYMPVMDKKMLMGVISFYDVAKFVVESQSFENKMLKAYIHDWPADESDGKSEPNVP